MKNPIYLWWLTPPDGTASFDLTRWNPDDGGKWVTLSKGQPGSLFYSNGTEVGYGPGGSSGRPCRSTGTSYEWYDGPSGTITESELQTAGGYLQLRTRAWGVAYGLETATGAWSEWANLCEIGDTNNYYYYPSVSGGGTTVDPAESIAFTGGDNITVTVTDNGGGAATVNISGDVDPLPAGTGQYKVLQLDGSNEPIWDYVRMHA